LEKSKKPKTCSCGCGRPVGKELFFLSDYCYQRKTNDGDEEHKKNHCSYGGRKGQNS
jgi:hypothetical protein